MRLTAARYDFIKASPDICEMLFRMRRSLVLQRRLLSWDRSTPAVFGDYIDVYDIQRAVDDGATVRIYYEGRLAMLD